MGLNSESKIPSHDMTRVRRSISFDPELLTWVDKTVAEDYHFKDRSHFIEVLIREYKNQIELKS